MAPFPRQLRTSLVSSDCCSFAPAVNLLRRNVKKTLVFAAKGRNYRLAQIARACGRVSVGGIRTRGRLTVGIKPAAGGEPANPALNGGSRLKATTDRAFLVSVGPPKANLPKRLVFLAGRAERDLPLPIDGCSDRNTCVDARVFRRLTAYGASPDRSRASAARSWIAGASTFVASPPRANEGRRASAEATGSWRGSTRALRRGCRK